MESSHFSNAMIPLWFRHRWFELLLLTAVALTLWFLMSLLAHQS